MNYFKILLPNLFALLCFSMAQAQWTNSPSTVVRTFDRVGIDETAPATQLHIKASSDRCIRLEEDGSGSEFIQIGVDNAGDLNIYRDNGSVGFSLLDANGNVGINTSAPGYRLDVNGSFRVRANNRVELQGTTDATGTANTGVLEIANALRLDGNEIITNTNAMLSINHDNNGDVRIDNGTFFTDASANRVGIGTTTPGSRLHVNGNLQIGSLEILSDEGPNTLGLNANFVPTAPVDRNLGTNAAPWANVVIDGALNITSDKRLKTDIQNLSYGLEEIMKLRPVSYDMKNAKGKKRLGLIAQELQPLIGEVVSGSEILSDEKTGKQQEVATQYLSVNYIELIPVLIKGMQEQQERIEKLEAQLTDTDAMDKSETQDTGEATKKVKPNTTVPVKVQGKVFQNNPNPFNSTSVVNYELPENALQAKLVLTALSGKQVAAYPLNVQQKNGQVQISAAGLPNGTYVYTLMADGQPIASNKMVIAR